MMTRKPIVALMYDFDKTLCTKDMQEYGFIPKMGMKPKDFWEEVKEFTNKNEMDGILAYMYKMVDKARKKEVKITRDDFVELGEGVEYFSGVLTWFDRINAYGKELGLEVEHYIVSSGIKEIIEGTEIAKYFKKIYACEFMYNYNDVIEWPKVAVNYTAKTQFLFRINKGVLSINTESSKKLNDYTPDDKRRVPFRNMIYIGDGLTDVPCMKLVKVNGGNSIAVFDEKTGSEQADALMENGRVNFVLPANYEEDSDLEQVVKAIMSKVEATEFINSLKK